MPNQNIYNDPSFFEGYSRLRWGETGLNKVMEEPAIRSLMPDLTGKRVLDLGCGFGHVARYARKMGAAEVLGVDISDRMIEAARQATEDSGNHLCRDRHAGHQADARASSTSSSAAWRFTTSTTTPPWSKPCRSR